MNPTHLVSAPETELEDLFDLEEYILTGTIKTATQLAAKGDPATGLAALEAQCRRVRRESEGWAEDLLEDYSAAIEAFHRRWLPN